MPRSEVLVVGGGIGGVSMALALGRQGRQVRLLEQSQEIAPIGYGVQIGPNVMPLFDRLGVGAAVRAASYLPPELQLFDAYSSARLAHVPLRTPQFDALFAHPYIAIHRVDLHEILLSACRSLNNVELVEASTATQFSQDPHRVRVECEDGRAFEADAMIACDGLRSIVRSQLSAADSPRDTGYVAFRSLVPMSEAPPSLRARAGVTMWVGDGFHVIYYPLRGQTELNIVAVFRAEPLASPGGDIADAACAAVANCRLEVRDAMSSMNLQRRWTIADREPLRNWGEGRVTLLGDSAHATLQSLAQGAGMAVEDVAVLDVLLRRHGTDYAHAFERFRRARLVRTARVQLTSRALWEDYHCGGIAAQVRNQHWSERSDADYLRCLQWLWTPIDPESAS